MSRFMITLNEKADRLIKNLVKETGKSKAEILREGLVLAEYMENQRKQGKAIGVINNGKIEKEIVLP